MIYIIMKSDVYVAVTQKGQTGILQYNFHSSKGSQPFWVKSKP